MSRLLLPFLLGSGLALSSSALLAQPYAYITHGRDSGTLTVVDTATHLKVTDIRIGQPLWGVATVPGASRVYVAAGTGVTVVNAGTNTMETAVPLTRPLALALSPDQSRVVVLERTPTNQDSTLTIIDAASSSVVDGITLAGFRNPHRVAVHPDGSRAYFTAGCCAGMADLSTSRVQSTDILQTGHSTNGIAVHPDGSRVYVTLQEKVVVLETAGFTVAGEIVVGPPFETHLEEIAVSPDGNRAYTTHAFFTAGGHVNNVVFVIDARADSLLDAVDLGAYPTGVAVTPDSREIWVTHPNSLVNSISVIDAGTLLVAERLDDGDTPPFRFFAPNAFGTFIGGPTGGPQVQLTESTVDFGAQTVGLTSRVHFVTLTNTGSSPLVLGTIELAGSDAGDFSFTGNCASGLRLDPGEFCTFDLAFTPTAGGPRQASLSIASNAAGSPHTVELRGQGVDSKLQFASLSFSAVEGGGDAVIRVRRVNGATGAAGVTCTAAGGTASQDSDYTPKSEVLTWEPGDTADRLFSVPIGDDPLPEPDETVVLTLSNPTGGAVLGSPASARLRIRSDDVHAYVSNRGDGTVSVIDTATDAVVATVLTGMRPWSVAAHPDGTHAYVTNDGEPGSNSDGTISVIRAGTATSQDLTLPASFTQTNVIFTSPDGAELFASGFTSDANLVLVYSSYTSSLSTTLPYDLNGILFGVTPSPDGAYLYASVLGLAAQVYAYDLRRNAITGGTGFGTYVPGGGIAASPDGSLLFVALDPGQDPVTLEDRTLGAVAIVEADAIEREVIDEPHSGPRVTIVEGVGEGVFGLAVLADGSRCYATSPREGAVRVIDASARALKKSLAVGGQPMGIAARPDGKRVYVANSADGTVSVIDTETDTVLAAPIPVGQEPIAYGRFIAPAIRDVDEDGVSDFIEAAAPDSGDGNADGIPDAEQAAVASLLSAVDRRYVTVVAAEGILGDVKALPAPAPGTAPPGVAFDLGLIAFSIYGLPAGGSTTVALFVEAASPAAPPPKTYFKLGPEPADRKDHWYEFDFDGRTGAKVEESPIVLHFVDGARGDADLAANGSITDPGGAAFAIVTPPGGRQLPGDCNQDGRLDISDALCTLGVLFLGTPARLPCGDGSASDEGNVTLIDWRGDGRIDIADGIGLLQFLFSGGPPHWLLDPEGGASRCVRVLECGDNSRCP